MPHQELRREPTAEEHLAAIYFTRIDELAETAPETDLDVLQARYASASSDLIKAALASVCGLLHSMDGSFGQAEHWFNVAASDAPDKSWVSGWVASVHAGHLLWNGDVDLADTILHESGSTEPSPFFWPQLSLIELYIDGFRGRVDQVKAAIRALSESDSGLMPPANASLIAVVRARIAVSLDDLDEAEVTIREALLTTDRTSRSAALLIDALSHVMARRGRFQAMHRCHREAMSILERWPGLLPSIHRRFHQLLYELGLTASAEALQALGQAKPDDHPVGVLRIRDIRADVTEALENGTPQQADRAIDALLAALAEHTRRFESFGSRRLSIHNLADLSTVAAEFGAAGRHDDMFRIFYQALRLVMTDASVDETTDALRVRLLSLLERSSVDGVPLPGVHQIELTDIQQLIRRLDWRLQTEVASSPPPRWNDVEVPANVVAFAQLDERIVRLDIIDGASRFSDRGPAADYFAAIRSLRLATAALGLGAPSGIDQVDAAAERLDTLMFEDCVWSAKASLTVMPNTVVQAIPWRLLPSLKPLEIGFGHRPGTTSPSQRPSRALIIAGPDPGFDGQVEADAIAHHYAESTTIEDASITTTRLVHHCGEYDVVHLAAMQRIDPLRTREALHDDDRPVRPHAHGRRTMAEVVVLGACDLETNERLQAPRLAWILLSYGVKSVIFSPLDLGEPEIHEIMPELHRLLAAGIRPEAALQQLHFDEPATQVAAESLVSFVYEP